MTAEKKLVGSSIGGRRKNYKLLLMILPFLIIIFMFCYIPLMGWLISFFDYKAGVPLFETEFVGLKYFRLMAKDYKEVLLVLRNTLVMSGLYLACAPLPMIVAILLNEVRSSKFRRAAQTVTTIPNFISWVIVFSMAYALFSYDGTINGLMAKFGYTGEATSVLTNSDVAWFFQLALSTWKSLGWNTIIYLAALAGIDNELYDAASVDGAGRFKRVLHVTIPGLMPTFIVLLLLSVSNMLSAGFDQFFIFKNPIVADKLEVLDVYIYRLGILNNDFSYATAMGLLKTFVSVTLLGSVNLISKKVRGNSIF